MMDNTNSTTYFLSHYTTFETAFLVLALVVIIIMSLLGGFIMLYVLYSNDKMWTSTNMLIGNLALASTFVAVFVMPFSLFTAAKGKWTFGEGNICKLTGFSASILLLTTIFTHTVISIDKYFAVAKPMSRAMTVKRTWILIAVVWSVAGAMSIVPLAGIARFEYNPTTLMCGVGFPRKKIDLLYLLMLGGIGFILPLVIMTYVYTRVYLAVKQHTARLLAHCVFSSDVLVLQKRLIMTVFASFVCFLMCWSTFFALTLAAVFIKDRAKLPHGLGVAAYWTGYLNSALNPIIICYLSNRFKEGFFDIYKSFKSCCGFSCARESRYLSKSSSSSKSIASEAVVYDSSTLTRYKRTNSKGYIETDDTPCQSLKICMQPFTQHDRDCSLYSDNPHCSCTVSFSDA